ncbi:hypothetical protein M758_2G039700 [Ceratodon purpureus]|nr:hypothetical protein M758_2G039700 [Ceratodon purpureus]
MALRRGWRPVLRVSSNAIQGSRCEGGEVPWWSYDVVSVESSRAQGGRARVCDFGGRGGVGFRFVRREDEAGEGVGRGFGVEEVWCEGRGEGEGAGERGREGGAEGGGEGGGGEGEGGE